MSVAGGGADESTCRFHIVCTPLLDAARLQRDCFYPELTQNHCGCGHLNPPSCIEVDSDILGTMHGSVICNCVVTHR